VDPLTVETNWIKDVQLSGIEIEELLFEWLNVIVFIKDVEEVVFCDARATVKHDSDKNLWYLDATLIGDRINVNEQELRTDVKAVTKHLYEVKQKECAWYAHVVLDV